MKAGNRAQNPGQRVAIIDFTEQSQGGLEEDIPGISGKSAPRNL